MATFRSKIEKGEFVELEKLLPKGRGSSFGARDDGASLLQWVVSEGQTYLALSTESNNKITHVKKWDQAFRSYATIYCGANPMRAQEVWQYISVIHTAASSYIWENVANYDYVFRHLMQFNPNRNWGKIYTQVWNLSMKDPINKFGKSNNSNWSGNAGQGGPARTGNSAPKTPKNKSGDYCWSWNRGIKCKYSRNCKYIERCGYCDASNHGKYNCPKLLNSGNSTAVATTSGAPVPVVHADK